MAHAALPCQQVSQGGCAAAARRAAGPDHLVPASTAAPICCAGRSEFRCSVVAARRRAFGGSSSSSNGCSGSSSLRRGVVARAALDNPPPPANSISTSSTVTASAAGVDPFVSASLRLQSLLSSIGDGDDELYNSYLSEEDPAAKMQTVTLLGGVLTVAAVVMASLCGRDPWGGASLSSDSLCAAAVGALLSIPMVYARRWAWAPESRKTVPVFEDMHLAQLEASRPWLQRLNRAHVVLLMAMEVLPATLLLFPAAQGVLVSSFALYTQFVQDSIAIDVSEETVRVWALLLTAFVASLGRVMELSASPEECEVVQTAVENSDRYYRVVGRDAANSPEEAQRSAVAFRAVAQAWLETKDEVANVAGVCTFLDVLYLGATWYLTGDLTATACCALLANWVDYYHMHEFVLQKEKKVASHSTHLR